MILIFFFSGALTELFIDLLDNIYLWKTIQGAILVYLFAPTQIIIKKKKKIIFSINLYTQQQAL